MYVSYLLLIKVSGKWRMWVSSRRDLVYRLDVLAFILPPLQERGSRCGVAVCKSVTGAWPRKWAIAGKD